MSSSNNNMQKKTRIPRPLPTTGELKRSSQPLAKAMEKKNKPPQPETYYDEKVESLSQRQHQQTNTEHEKRKEDLYAQLKKTEEELVAMQDLLDQREKLLEEAQKDGEEKELSKTEGEESEEMAGQTENGQGEQQTSIGENKFTKKSLRTMRERMQEMREKLHKMNRETDNYLADIENTVHYLDSLQSASERAGPVLSLSTRREMFGDLDDDQIIAQLYQENTQPRPEKEEGEESEEEGDNEEEVAMSSEEKSPHQGKPKGSKFFITEKSAVAQDAGEIYNADHNAD